MTIKKAGTDEGFLSRWSRQKLDEQTADEHTQPEELAENSAEAERDDLDESSLPVWQRADADPETKKTALQALFRQPEFKDVDRLNEYDEDFTSFKGLGDVVTQEMKRMLRLAEQKIRPDNEIKPDNKTDISTKQSHPEDSADSKDNEDSELA